MGLNLNAHGYQETKAATPGEFIKLPPGGYVCTVVNAEVAYAKSGNTMLVFFLEIAEGEFKDYFIDALKHGRERKSDLRWDNGGIFRQNVYNKDNKTSPFFKGLIEKLLHDNPNVKANFDNFEPACLFGATLGMVFAEEAYTYQGKSGVRVVPKIPQRVEDIRSGNFKVPELKDKPAATTSAPAKDDFEGTIVEPEDTPF